MVAGGVLGDRFGHRRVMLIGLSGMLGAGLVVALAPSPAVLVVGHVTLSMFTAVVIPLSLAGVMITFGPAVRPVAIALYLAVQLSAALASPPLAQLTFDLGGFPATFLPALVATVAALVALYRWLPVTPRGNPMSGSDAASLFLWSLGMLAIVYGLVAIAGGWGSLREIALLVGVMALLVAGVRLARRSGRLELPHVPFRIVAVTLVTGAILGITQSGTLLQLSNFLKGVQGYGDLASALALAPYVLATLVVSLATGAALARRYRGDQVELAMFRRPITVGMGIVGISMLMLGLIRVDTGYLLIGVALGLLGLGASLANVPRTDLLFRSIRSDRVGVAAGLNGSSVLVGEALGNVAVTAMVAIAGYANMQGRLIAEGKTVEEAAGVIAEATRAAFLAAAHPFLEPSFLDVAVRVPGWPQSFTYGFTSAMLVFAGLALAGAVVVLIGLRERIDSQQEGQRA
jgi:DHA2 family multidrug resistance protein-like MFS transporter